ncbi:uncharacterized protein LOC142240512 [Haematobia irritans]|uniref:uncharacterized protein LOC142240512 n=1 Tax=Haematobia irritans TaxID=7368 RepID=UPI003F4FBBBE
MSLSLSSRRRDKTLSAIKTKWTSQQHLSQQADQHHHQTVRKQRSFIESSSKLLTTCNNSNGVGNSRPYLTRGLSVGRSPDIQQRLHSKHILRKHASIGSNHAATATKSVKSDDLIKRNITSCNQIDRRTRSVQAWSSTSSILKSLDKELTQLNNALIKSKDIRNDIEIERTSNIANNNKSTNKTKTDSGPSTVVTATNSKVNKTSSTTANSSKVSEVNKVNLSIVLSHALNSSKENDYILCDPGDEDESEDISTDSEKLNHCERTSVLSRGTNKSEENSKTNISSAQQRRALYQTSKLTEQTNTTSTSQLTYFRSDLSSPSQIPLNVTPALTVQKRPPLVRAMSAPVRSIDENSKGSCFANKRKPRRRKLNTRTITCDRDSSPPGHLTSASDLNFDTKSSNGKKLLQRSRSVAPDVITLVSLISSEGSDSEKEDCPSTPTNSDCSSPTRRPPSLRKSGKSVSFQENYPPTFQFASKEYSHMLRRGSIAPLAARIKSNRPPTAPPVSIFHTANNSTSKLTKDMNEEEETNVVVDENHNDESPSNTSAISKKPLEEENYQYPEYVRSIKERECWKLFQKMSAKGVNITYDTILRGMLTPTEFRQLQKQREIEEAKLLKENEELEAQNEEQTKSSKTTSNDKLSENLLKN